MHAKAYFLAGNGSLAASRLGALGLRGQSPPTKRTTSGWFAMRCVSVTVELLVSPTSATRPMVCGKLSAPTGLPVLKENSADVAFGALVAKSPTLQHCPR